MLAAVESLNAVEIRVLGCLLEKDITTPEYYPLTLNALVNACNQKSSREPVVQYDERTVAQALELLKSKGLATRLSGPGHRVEKFGHRLGEQLNLGRREVALLCVLMLRGPQTVGELRGRTERMHDFADLDEVTRVLDSLAAREAGALVREGSRGRWWHLLGDAAEMESEGQSPPGPTGAPARLDAEGSAQRLEDRVAALEREVAELRAALDSLRRQFE